MYDFLNLVGSKKQGMRSKSTDYQPTKNDKVVRFFVTSKQVSSTELGLQEFAASNFIQEIIHKPNLITN